MNNNSNNGQKSGSRNLLCVTKDSPCPHCGKTDWCYSIGELSVCNRDEPPATGWEATTKSDADGHFFYAPVRPKKPIRPAQTRYWEYPSRDGEKLVRVRRIDFGNGKKKDIKQQHWDETLNKWETNLKGISRASIPIYRYPDIQKAITDDQLIFIVDGEQCADYLWDLGLAATTSIGGMGKWRITDTSDLQGAKVVISPDRDNPGLKDAAKVSEHFPDAQWLYSDPDSWEWDNPPESDGLDVMDWIKDKGLNAQDILNSLTSRPRTQENVVSLSFSSSESDYIPDTAPSGEQSFIHKAIDALYSGRRWASVAGQLLEYTGTHYEVRSEGSEKRRIYAWLKTYTEFVKGKYRCNRYNSASTNDVYNCIVGSVDVDIKDINPPGLNCSNGVLRINPDGSHTLYPHNPDQIYTYVGGKYDPDIDPRDCDRLLECLEPAQREIFLRTVAASLCLPLVRLKMSRVKGLLCHGDGSNGKDALRTALVAVLGRGVTGKTLKDFQIYDTGRKFPLAGLEGSLCNWSSENSDSAKLEKLQSLKQFITGDELTIEHKGKGEYPYKPEAIFLANCNLLPSISSDAEAIKSRYSILSFKKTYAVGADASKGQLEADPRFKEDPSFVLEKIAPALLNRMLERLPSVLKEGIDYNSTNAALRAAQEKSNHLWQFMRDRGYEAGKGERVYAKDAWSDLQDWYIETGTLELEPDRDGKEKRVWNELPGRDTPVKAINQLFARLSELVPNLEKYRHTEGIFDAGRTKGDFYYLGITKHTSEKNAKSAPPAPPVDTASILPPPVLHQEIPGGALVEQTTLTQSGGGAGGALSSLSEENEKTAPASPAVDTASILPPAVLQQNISAGALLEQTTLTQSGGGAAGALSSPFSQLCNLLSQLTEDERQRMVDSLTGVPCSDPLKAFRVGDKVAGNKPEDSSYNWHGRIVEITTSISCRVDWQEREGMRGGRIISMLFCNLRKI